MKGRKGVQPGDRDEASSAYGPEACAIETLEAVARYLEQTESREAQALRERALSCVIGVEELRASRAAVAHANANMAELYVALEEAKEGGERANEQLARVNDDLREARRVADEACRMKSEFLANMSHEIRTPMNGVVGMTELLAHTELNDDQRDMLGTVRRSADALLKILNDILDFSKIESGKLALEEVDVDLRELAEDVVELLSFPAHEKGIELAIIAEPGDLRVSADPVRLRQVVTNLVANAVKFTEEGHVTVTLATEKGADGRVQARVGVRDTGIGISKKGLSRLFEAFSQADASTTRRFGGTGLGLAIVRKLCRIMGGDATATSTLGEGSTFSCVVRLGAPTGPPVAIEPRLVGKRVHLVLPSGPVRAGLEQSLASLGVQIIGDAAAADVLLLDARAAVPNSTAPLIRLTRCVATSSDASETPLVAPVRVARLSSALLRALGMSRTFRPKADLRAPEPLRARVLLVEDNEVNRKVAVAVLKRLGCDVWTATDGCDACEQLETCKFDLVLMDCQMPVMDGFEATALIRKREKERGTPHLPIIALTANAMASDRTLCLDAGMDDFLSKPFKSQALGTVLEKWFSRAEAA